jgi:hypothetical protein
MHLHASETSTRKIMHFFWGYHAYLASMSLLVSTAIVTLRAHQNNDQHSFESILQLLLGSAMCYTLHTRHAFHLDQMFYDIPDG